MSKKALAKTPPPFDELRAVYQDLDARPLARSCELRTTCCHFRVTGRTPSVTRIEALYAAKGYRASGRKTFAPRADGACPCMDAQGRCFIYAHRPFGCRTHFCEAAGGMYPRKHVADLIQRLEALDEKIHWHEGPRELVGAMADALDAK